LLIPIKTVSDNRRRHLFVPGRPPHASGIWQPFQSILKNGAFAGFEDRLKHRIKLQDAMKMVMNMPESSQD
jgi:hypothetical protein